MDRVLLRVNLVQILQLLEGMANVTTFYRWLIVAFGHSGHKIDQKCLGGDTVKVVDKKLEDHHMVEALLQVNDL